MIRPFSRVILFSSDSRQFFSGSLGVRHSPDDSKILFDKGTLESSFAGRFREGSAKTTRLLHSDSPNAKIKTSTDWE